MSKTQAGKKRASVRATTKSAEPRGRIHPVIIYPFHHPADYTDLEALYELVARLDKDKRSYARPFTVIERKTHQIMAQDRPFLDFRKRVVSRHSQVLDAWCVDTCQMWYSGFGQAFEAGRPDDVYWL